MMSPSRKKGKPAESSSTCESLVISIREEIDTVTQHSSSFCIYKVPKLLRKLNEQAYTPQLVSIGPFHHKNERLLSMETHKLKYLQSFLHDSQDNADLHSYLQLIKDNEARMREFYSEPIPLSSHEFTRMVLIDSAFIIELFRTFDIITPFTRAELIQDLRLVENQLPFFILKELYSAWLSVNKGRVELDADSDADSDHEHYDADSDQIINTPSFTGIILPKKKSFTDIACAWLGVDKGRVQLDADSNEAAESCCHLLDLVRSHLLPPRRNIKEAELSESSGMPKESIVCPTATSLHEAGVKFRSVLVDGRTSLLDIHFDEKKGILTIPRIRFHGPTESWFRNMIAFEQCHYRKKNYFADYHFFLDCLINTWEDVQVLAKAGVIENWLGNEKDVSNLINSVGTNVSSNRRRYYYGEITYDLVAHCNRRWNRYRATLKHTYFRHPWAVVSVIYAVILLVLTIIQVVTGVLAVPHVMN